MLSNSYLLATSWDRGKTWLGILLLLFEGKSSNKRKVYNRTQNH